jgi:hypothetical protein
VACIKCVASGYCVSATLTLSRSTALLLLFDRATQYLPARKQHAAHRQHHPEDPRPVHRQISCACAAAREESACRSRCSFIPPFRINRNGDLRVGPLTRRTLPPRQSAAAAQIRPTRSSTQKADQHQYQHKAPQPPVARLLTAARMHRSTGDEHTMVHTGTRSRAQFPVLPRALRLTKGYQELHTALLYASTSKTTSSVSPCDSHPATNTVSCGSKFT